MTGRVFVVQRPAYYDRLRRGWVNKYDLTPAETYGELVYLLRPGNIYRDKLEDALERLHEVLADYGPDDHILAVGDPIAIAAAVLVAASKNNGKISMLKFDRQTGEYDPYVVEVARNNG